MKTINYWFTETCDSLACCERTIINKNKSVMTNCGVINKNNPAMSREDSTFTFTQYLDICGVYASTVCDNIFDINIEYYWDWYTRYCSSKNIKASDDLIETLNDYLNTAIIEYGKQRELLHEYDDKLAAYLESKYGSLYDFEMFRYGACFWEKNKKETR